jgi:hypothetical protein
MQNTSELIHHDIDLSAYGKTPSGKPLFRVIWAPNRVEKLHYRITKQMIEVKMYPDCEMWVLEKWMSALDYAGPRDSFDEQQKKSEINMEYPADGEYAECMRFPSNEAVRMAPQAVEFLLYGKANVSEKERIQALRLREELKEKDQDERASAIIRDALNPQWSGNRVKLYDAAGNIIN